MEAVRRPSMRDRVRTEPKVGRARKLNEGYCLDSKGVRPQAAAAGRRAPRLIEPRDRAGHRRGPADLQDHRSPDPHRQPSQKRPVDGPPGTRRKTPGPFPPLQMRPVDQHRAMPHLRKPGGRRRVAHGQRGQEHECRPGIQKASGGGRAGRGCCSFRCGRGFTSRPGSSPSRQRQFAGGRCRPAGGSS